MKIFPAIDLFQGQAVRLFKGDYAQMTVYHSDPLQVALDFQRQGASCIHLVDLEGAKTGGTGGGIRSMDTVRAYLDHGVNRVILGTAAVTDESFLKEAISSYGEKIAVGVDIRDGYVAIKGWTENSQFTCDAFFAKMQTLGVKTMICTDISRDGAMKGANLALYQRLSETYDLDIVASGGVSSLSDVIALRDMQLYGAIIGKAYYTGAINLRQAIEAAE